jgi:glycine betaine/proline transport system ATP-binding protein
MANEDKTALECRNLWRVFGNAVDGKLDSQSLPVGDEAISLADDLRSAGDIVACGDINLKIKNGEFFVLMDLSGSGKSTLMRCMSRLTEPTAGELLIDGEDFLNISDQELM